MREAYGERFAEFVQSLVSINYAAFVVLCCSFSSFVHQYLHTHTWNANGQTVNSQVPAVATCQLLQRCSAKGPLLLQLQFVDPQRGVWPCLA